MTTQVNCQAWDRLRNGLTESDSSYFRRRAAEERAVAIDAYHPRVRQAHLEMAERYEDLARAVEAFEHHLDRKLEIIG